MPFAPVTIAELAPKCFKGWRLEDRCADFMTMTYDVTQEFLVDCPAAVHVDKTARPQVVRRESDPELHAILAEYFRLTGELAILNTSFNNHEEPIVCSPTDALASYGIGNIDALLIEGALVDGSGH
jgi:carbamoyltransferase